METQMDKEALQNDHKHLKVLKSPSKSTQRTQRQPKGTPKGAQVVPRCQKSSPKVSQKAPQSDPQTTPEYEPSSEILISPKCLENTVTAMVLEPRKTNCLSMGTGSAFKGGEFDKHGSNSCVDLTWGKPQEYIRNTQGIHEIPKEYLNNIKGVPQEYLRNI